MNNSTRLKKGLFDVLSRFSGRLHEDKTVLASEHLTLICADLPAGVQVALIADEHDGHVGVAVLLDLLKPPCQVGERIAPRDVIYQKCAGRAAIIRPCDALERLLAGRVPDLQLDVFLLNLDCAGTELDSDGQVVLLAEPLVCELKEEARLSDTCISDNNIFE